MRFVAARPLMLAAWLACAGGCFDTPVQAVVHVTVDGFSMTPIAELTAREVTLELHAVSTRDAGTTPDGGSSSDVVRQIFWNGSNAFTFDVQLPAGTYGSVVVEALHYTQCPDGSPLRRVGARGTSTAPVTAVLDAPASVNVHVVAADEGHCAM